MYPPRRRRESSRAASSTSPERIFTREQDSLSSLPFMSKFALIGAGNMARAMARGWRASGGGPTEILVCDAGSGRAEVLASEVGATVVANSTEALSLAETAVLAVKPAALESLAADSADFSGVVVSLLAGTSLETLEKAFPNARCVRVMPNVGVEKRRGVLCVAFGSRFDGADGELIGYLEDLGLVVEISEHLFDAATAVMGCSPAYFAMVAEAIADAGVRAGLGEEVSNQMVAEALAGTAELLADRDTLEVRRAVTSPGGSTAVGLAALERGAVRAAFAEAVAASIARMQE